MFYSLTAISALYFIEHSKQNDRILRYEINQLTYSAPGIRPGGGRGSFNRNSYSGGSGSDLHSPNDPFLIQSLHPDRQKIPKKITLNINTTKKPTTTSIITLKSDHNLNKNATSTTVYQSITSDDLEKPDEYEHQTYTKNDIKGKKEDNQFLVRNVTAANDEQKDKNNLEIVQGVISKPNDLNWTNEVIPDNDVEANVIDSGQRNTQNGSKWYLFSIIFKYWYIRIEIRN